MSCKWFSVILSVVIFVLAFWPNLLGALVSKWVIAVAAILFFVHALKCKKCNACDTGAKVTKAKARVLAKRKSFVKKRSSKKRRR